MYRSPPRFRHVVRYRPPGNHSDLPLSGLPSRWHTGQVPLSVLPDNKNHQIRKELGPPVSGFFAVSPNAPVQGALIGEKLELRCSVPFVAQTLDRPDILELVSRKAGAMLGRPIRTVVVDLNARPAGNPRMEQLMNFGRAHSDIVKIKK